MALSLAICLATAVLWVRSYYAMDWLVREDQAWVTHGVWAVNGRITAYQQIPTIIWKDRNFGPGHWMMSHFPAEDAVALPGSAHPVLGFDFIRPQSDYVIVILPLWFFTSASALTFAYIVWK